MRRSRHAALIAFALLLGGAPVASADRFTLDEPAPFSSDVTLTGTASSESGTPLPGRQVVVRGRPDASNGPLNVLGSTTTDGAGTFRLVLRIAEPYLLQAGDGASDWGNTIVATPTPGATLRLTLNPVAPTFWPARAEVSGTAPPGSTVRIEGRAYPYRGTWRGLATVQAGADGAYRTTLRLDRRTQLRAVGATTTPVRTATLTPRVVAVDVRRLPQRRYRVAVRLAGPPALRVPRGYVYVGPVKAKRLRRVGRATIRRTAPGRFTAVRTVALPRGHSEATVSFCFVLPTAWAALSNAPVPGAPAQAQVALVSRCGTTAAG